MPNVLASSGIIGTSLGDIFLSLNKFVNILTKAIVVDISFSPVDTFMKSKISFEGALIGLAKVERSGKYPPNLILLSFMYFISGDFSSGLKYSIFLTCSSVKGTSNRSL